MIIVISLKVNQFFLKSPKSVFRRRVYVEKVDVWAVDDASV